MNEIKPANTNESTAQKRAKSEKIDEPSHIFEGWFFKIEPFHWEIFGISKREFVKNKKPYLAWAIDRPETLTVFPGYIFYERTGPQKYVQIAACWQEGGTKTQLVEAHQGEWGNALPRRAIVTTTDALRLWLQTGVPPASAYTVDKANSKAGLMAWQLK